MVVESILKLFLSVPNFLLNLIPTVDFTFPSGIFNSVNSLVGSVMYVLPIVQLMPIFYISFGLLAAKLSIALVVRVKSFIPTMGA